VVRARITSPLAPWFRDARPLAAARARLDEGPILFAARDRAWRALFIIGLITSGFVWHFFAGPAPVRENFGLGWAAAAGLLVGFGTRVGGGCTSGHGVCGLGRFSLRSLVAVAVFMATGIAAAVITPHVLGVAS